MRRMGRGPFWVRIFLLRKRLEPEVVHGFHAVTSANGRFKTGQIMDVGAEGLDVYNTMLDAMGAPRRLGPSGRGGRSVDAIRA